MGSVIQTSRALRELFAAPSAFSDSVPTFIIYRYACIWFMLFTYCFWSYLNYNFKAVASYLCATAAHFEMLYLYAVMVMGRPAWLNLIPQLCLAPLTWAHHAVPPLTHSLWPFLSHSSSTTLLSWMQQMLGNNPTLAGGNSFPFSTVS